MDQPLVSRDAEIMSGALYFSGTRVPVKQFFDYLEGSSLERKTPDEFYFAPLRPLLAAT